MTGYTVDPAALEAAAAVLRSAIPDVQLAEVDAGPGRVNTAVAAFTAHAQTTLNTVTANLDAAATTVTTTRNTYLETETDTAWRLR
ncbi:hypothetical protein [Actinokineospora diospyrosa]|uniref:PE family protein n=1 Tax=Actinokineospora diospyrosa TaxID=103728 RepID=A0ABT1IK34_9PSEU|nr:hypothetical protein [Actinokineospora diospyrosa]MCP2273015.1 hypothetical protein [Actinokineospora diospyrosa]